MIGGASTLSKAGTGTLILGGGATDTSANTFTGLTTVTAGTLSLSKASATNTIAGNITLNGGTLSLARANQIADTATISIIGGTAGSNTGGISSTMTETVAAISVTGNTSRLNFGSGSNVTVTGALTLNGNNSANTVTAFSLAANTTASTLRIGSANFTNSYYNLGQSGNTSVPTLILGGGFTGASTSSLVDVTTNKTGKLVFDGAGTHDHTFDIASGTTTISVATSETASTTANLIKNGAGLLFMNANATYSGTTTVNAGFLQVLSPASLPGWNEASKVTVSGTGSLVFSAGGASQWSIADIDTLRGIVTFPSGTGFGIDTSGGNVTYAGPVGSTGNTFTKGGTNTLFLTGTLGYTGATNLRGGTLDVSGASTPGLLSGSVLNMSGTSTLALGPANQTLNTINTADGLNGTITGTGGLTLNGDVNFDLSANNFSVVTTRALNLSTLPSFTYSAPTKTFSVSGTGANSAGNSNATNTLILSAGTNNITASTFNVGATIHGGSGIVTATTWLGHTNTINASTITIGTSKVNAKLAFPTGLSANPQLTLNGTTGGTSRATMVVGQGNSNSANATALVDLTTDVSGTSSLTAFLSTLTIGSSVNTTTARSVTGSFLMGGGTLDATTIVLGQNTANVANTSTGTFSVTGGTVKATTLTFGNRTGSSGNVTSTFNLLGGGTLRATTIQPGAGTATRTLNWGDGAMGRSRPMTRRRT